MWYNIGKIELICIITKIKRLGDFMLAKERQNFIYRCIKENGAVYIAEISRRLSVCTETVRRDLFLMEQEKLLVRVHGGAVAYSEMNDMPSLSVRTRSNVDEKNELSSLAASFISEGDIIAIDEGSTAVSFANVLKERFEHLTVITYSLDVFEILREKPDFKILLIGGYYNREERFFCGSQAMDALETLHCKSAFIFPSAISLNHGLGFFLDDALLLIRKMIKSADSVYVLFDSSKIERSGFLCSEELRKEYTYITDSKVSDEMKRIYSENGYELLS